MIAGSLFSGVGGMDLGLARAGITHAFFAESDPWRRDVLAAHWPGTRTYTDVRDVGGWEPRRVDGGRDEPEPREGRPRRNGDHPRSHTSTPSRPDTSHRIDVLCGGFPCQDLSVAGKRAGLAGARSGLFHEYARITDALRPTWLLIENVPGLLSSNDGRDFGVVLGTLAELGYGIAWRVLDARYFGVAQRRRRVFLVGHSGGDPAPALRALCESCDGDPPPRDCTWTRPPSTTRGGADEASVVNALGAAQGGPDDNDAQAGHLVPQRAGVRRLTPTECERLMSWPDGWTAPDGVKAPDSRRYAACGDGVVANVAEWIARGIQAV